MKDFFSCGFQYHQYKGISIINKSLLASSSFAVLLNIWEPNLKEHYQCKNFCEKVFLEKQPRIKDF